MSEDELNEGLRAGQRSSKRDDQANLRLVVAIAKKYRSAIWNFGPDPGRTMGLERGVEKFDPTRLQVLNLRILVDCQALTAIAQQATIRC